MGPCCWLLVPGGPSQFLAEQSIGAPNFLHKILPNFVALTFRCCPNSCKRTCLIRSTKLFLTMDIVIEPHLVLRKYTDKLVRFRCSFTLRPIHYCRACGPWPILYKIIRLVKKPKTIEVHFTLISEGLRDQRKLNGFEESLHNNKWKMFHGLRDIMLGPSKRDGRSIKWAPRNILLSCWRTKLEHLSWLLNMVHFHFTLKKITVRPLHDFQEP